MASSLQGTKRRIKSVNSTRKVTKAMELVATAKLKKSKDKLEKIKVYTDEVKRTIRRIMVNSTEVNSVFLKPNESDVRAFVVVTSNLGLCGGYNANILKLAFERVNLVKDVMYVIGAKGVQFFGNRKYNILEEYQNVDFNYTCSKLLTEKLMAMYQKGEINGVELIYTEFVNSVTFVPHAVELLPFVQDTSNDDEAKYSFTDEVKYEPNPVEILNQLIPFYIESTIYGYVLESEVSENASRRTAMENASDNADEIIDELKLQYNKARQGAITQEITEIISGADAL